MMMLRRLALLLILSALMLSASGCGKCLCGAACRCATPAKVPA
jgi:hypothetical protein